MSARGTVARFRSAAPLHVWERHHPQAHAIADAIHANSAVLNLRTRRLQRDVQARYGVCASTARAAIAIARKSA